MNQPQPPEPDDKDWTWVLDRRCAQCGFDANNLDRARIGDLVESVAAAFATALARSDAAVRPDARVWSPLEYGCHVRDVCRVFCIRLHLMLDQDNPLFENWDQDQSALAGRYWERDAVVTARELAEAASTIARAFGSVNAAQWERPGRRSNGSEFTVDTLGRYFAHDLVHHVHDIGG